MNYSQLGFDKEKEVRIALESYFGQPFVKKTLYFQGLAASRDNTANPRGRKEFNAVFADGSVVAMVKNPQPSGAGAAIYRMI